MALIEVRPIYYLMAKAFKEYLKPTLRAVTILVILC